MTLAPEIDKDGPVVVTFENGEVEKYDRLAHYGSGLITFYDVESVSTQGGGNTRWVKGDRARSVPRERIEHIDWEGY